MKSKDVHLGAVYMVKVSGALVPVKITAAAELGGWHGLNTVTGRSVRIRSPQRIRSEASSEKIY